MSPNYYVCINTIYIYICSFQIYIIQANISKMALKSQCLPLFMTLMLLLVIKIEGDSIKKEANKDVDIISPSSPPPLPQPNAVVNQFRPIQCGTQWCGQGIFPPREVCCNNQCVDITSDRDNCGLCGRRCILNRQCCNRLCTDINMNPFNCGGCGNICPVGSFCFLGRCSWWQMIPAVPLTLPPPLVAIPSPQVLPSPQSVLVENAPKPEPHQAESPTQPPIMENV